MFDISPTTLATECDDVDFQKNWNVIKTKGVDILVDYLIYGKTAYPPKVDAAGRLKTILFSNSEYASLYTLVYVMSTERAYGTLIYHEYEETVRTFFRDYLSADMKAAQEKPPEVYLKVVTSCLEKAHKFVSWLYHILYYLDRYHVSLVGKDPLMKCSQKIWVKEFLSEQSSNLISSILHQVEFDRRNSLSNSGTYKPTIDTHVLKMVTGALVEMATFNSAPLMEYKYSLAEETAAFYSQLNTVKINVLSCADYLNLVRSLIDEEDLRSQWLLGDMLIPIQAALTKEMLAKSAAVLMDKPSGVAHFLKYDMTAELSLCYDLINRCADVGIPHMASIWESFLKETGIAILQAKLDSMKNPAMQERGIEKASANAVPASFLNPVIADYGFVKTLINFHAKYCGILKECFRDDFQFKVKLKDSMSYVMNRNIGGVHMACYLCTACDKLVRRPQSSMGGLPSSQQGVIDACHNIVALFAYIADKDLSAEIYRAQLSKRLVGAETPPNETERLLISTFKNIYGHSYSNKIEGMLNDVASGMPMRSEFAKYLAMNGFDNSINFTVQVLTSGHWPSSQSYPLNLPPAVEKAQAMFKQWYDTKTAHRQLIWNNALSQAIIKVHFTNTYSIVCSVAQAVLLMAFNDREPKTVSKLCEVTKLNATMCRKLIKSLFAKYSIILKLATESEEEIYILNEDFVCNQKRFKLPLPIDNENRMQPSVEEDRSMSIQACLIRIMKARREFPHTALVGECIEQLHMFQPSVKQIKENIERLIEKDLLSRSEKDPQNYLYH